jgi:peptidoglycan/LPS O-acetylase OafA/YrhL
LFFVLSGFCLSFPIFSRAGQPTRWGRYAIARIRRIVPPYWAALFLFGGISLISPHAHFHTLFGGEVLWPGIRSFVIDGMLFWRQIMVGPFWTLVVEWRWYFLFPICIWLCRNAGAWVMLLISVPLSALSMWMKFGLDMNWAISWTQGAFRYLPLFAFGLLASQLAVSGGRSAAERFLVWRCDWGAMLFLAVLFILPANPQHTWQATVQSTMTFGPFAFFATIGAVRNTWINRFLSWRPLVWVGGFSYSLYLLHGPFVNALGSYFLPRVGSRVAIFALLTVVTPAIIIAASYLFFLAFERPFLSRRSRSKTTEAAQFERLREAAVP